MSGPSFRLRSTDEAQAQLAKLETDNGLAKRWKSVKKALGNLQRDPRHPSLNTHKYETLRGPNGEEIFEAYAENRTPAAYRIFWCYGPGRREITILAVTSHP